MLGVGFQNMNNKNLSIISKGTILGVGLTALIIAGIYFVAQGEKKEIGLVFLGMSAVSLFVFFLFFIPTAQRLEFTNQGIVFYSYKQCRTYFWSQIKDVIMKNNPEGNQQLIVEIYQSESSKTKHENSFEISINAQVYGYSQEDLYQKIKKIIIQQTAAR
jgi:hypothetical protein